ncbi:MAG: extracellular solute-binding protein [Candidatus Omnitrophica bacterium]|nr:extracellular solute-binding protein [Candidatus Omnitrophota bacterium]MCM8802162.1 extracellular solute-binding protein [Candidatus Omnitrophota bacterium]
MVKKIFLVFSIIFSFGKGERNLIIISPHWEGIKIEITRAFCDWYEKNYKEKVKIEWIDQGGTSDDLKYVESLFKKNPEGIGIDIFFGGGLSPYLKLKSENLLLKYKLPQNLLKKISKYCAGIPNYDNEFYWYGVVLSGFGILYNKRALKFLNLPDAKTWKDLGNPVYYSLIGAADPRHSGSMHMMYEIILQTYGWEEGWKTIFSISGNTKNFSTSASEVARETSIGEAVLSLCIDSYALAQIEVNGKENMGFILPENETVINPDCIGILKGAPNIEIAKRFVDFLFTYEGQLLWIQKKGKKGGPKEYSLNRFPVMPEIYNDPQLEIDINPYKIKNTIKYDFQLAANRWNLIDDMIGCLIIDCHSELKKAWYILSKTNNRRLKEKFYEIPFDKKVQRFLWENWKDPIFRNRYINEWINFSLKKYRDIIVESKFLM